MLEELCKRIQHCCAMLRRSRNKRNVGSCWWLKSLTCFKLCATTFNNMQRGVQTDATCNIQQCLEFLVNNVSFVCTQPKDRVTKVIQRFTVTPGQAYPHMSHLWIHYLKIESVPICHNQCQIGQIPIWLQFPFQSEAKAFLMQIKWIIFTRKICPQPRIYTCPFIQVGNNRNDHFTFFLGVRVRLIEVSA